MDAAQRQYTAILICQHRGLVSLQHMVPTHLLVRIIVEDCKVAVCTLNRPVCHVLSGDLQAVVRKLLFLTVVWYRVDILDRKSVV